MKIEENRIKNLLTSINGYVIVYRRDKDLGLFFMLKIKVEIEANIHLEVAKICVQKLL